MAVESVRVKVETLNVAVHSLPKCVLKLFSVDARLPKGTTLLKRLQSMGNAIKPHVYGNMTTILGANV